MIDFFIVEINPNEKVTSPKCLFSGDMDIRIANKYRLGRKIGGGSFGDIYVGKTFRTFYESLLSF